MGFVDKLGRAAAPVVKKALKEAGSAGVKQEHVVTGSIAAVTAWAARNSQTFTQGGHVAQTEKQRLLECSLISK